MKKKDTAFYQNPFGQLLLQEVAASNMGISDLCVSHSEEVRNRRKQYAVDYICQFSAEDMVTVEDTIWRMNYVQVVNNFAEYWCKQLVGHWMVRQWGSHRKQLQECDYQMIRAKFKKVFQNELERDMEIQRTRGGNPKMALQFEDVGYMTEPHFMHAIEKAAAIVDLTIRIDAC